MSLTDQTIKAALPRAKPYKLSDGDGLVLVVTPNDTKLWRLRFKLNGRESMVSLGRYPEVSLKAAREKALRARGQVIDGESPSEARQALRAAAADTFACLAREYLDKLARKVAENTLARDANILDRYVLPVIGSMPLFKIEARHVLDVLARMESVGRKESIGRAKALTGRVFRLGLAQGRLTRNPCADFKLSDAVKLPATKHRAAILEPGKLGELLRSIDSYTGQLSTKGALQLLPHVVLRSSELRGARWSEIDWVREEWRVPADRMKMEEAHVVPLSKQALRILASLAPKDTISTHALIFPSYVPGRCISYNTMNHALMRMGYSRDEHTPHGFRATFASLQSERGVNGELVELQLAHKERNQVRAAYARSARLEQRREMMQSWSDYLDGIKRPAK